MKQDVVDAGVAAVQAAEVAALKEQLGLAYDSGVSDAQGGGLSQADVDAAVQAVKDADAAILEAAKADFQAQLSAVQQALSDMTAKEQLEEAAVADVKAKIDSVQEAFDKTGRIINITVAPNNNYDPPRLLNYLTAPHVCVWSAAAASCALFDWLVSDARTSSSMIFLKSCPNSYP